MLVKMEVGLRDIELILHVGEHKTGTTALQNFLYSNRESLLNQKILYPTFSMNHGVTNHNWLVEYLLKDSGKHMDDTVSDRFDFYRELCRKVKRYDCKKVIISGESLGRITSGFQLRLYGLVKKFNYKIVLYHRSPLGFIESLYNESIKNGLLHSVSEHIDTQMVQIREGHVAERLRVLMQVYGHDRLIVRPYMPTLLKNGDIISDFAMISGINLEALDRNIEISHQNKRIPNQYVSLCRQINLLGEDSEIRRKRMSILMNYALQSEKIQDKDMTIFTPEQLEALNHASKRPEKYIADGFMDIQDPMLYKSDGKRVYLPDYSTTYKEIVREIVMPLLDALDALRLLRDQQACPSGLAPWLINILRHVPFLRQLRRWFLGGPSV